MHREHGRSAAVVAQLICKWLTGDQAVVVCLAVAKDMLNILVSGAQMFVAATIQKYHDLMSV